jgi:hypothetical protein
MRPHGRREFRPADFDTELSVLLLAEEVRDLPIAERLRRQALRVEAAKAILHTARAVLRVEIVELRRAVHEATHGG